MNCENEILIQVQTEHNGINKLQLKIAQKADIILREFVEKQIISQTDKFEIKKRAVSHFTRKLKCESNEIKLYILQFIVNKLDVKNKQLTRKNARLVRILRN